MFPDWSRAFRVQTPYTTQYDCYVLALGSIIFGGSKYYLNINDKSVQQIISTDLSGYFKQGTKFMYEYSNIRGYITIVPLMNS